MFKKLLIPVLILLAFPFLIILINKITTLYYNRSYQQIDQGVITSPHYQMIQIKLSGIPQELTGYTTEIDSMYVDTIPTTPVDSSTVHKIDPKSFKTYGGHIYIDTVKRLLHMETREDSVDGKGGPTGDYKQHYLTLNLKGKIIADSVVLNPEKAHTYPNGYLVPDVLIPFQPWLDENQPIYIHHFAKQNFNSYCFNPLRGWGSPNGAGNCYFWDGTAFYVINFHKELLKFKLPCSSGAFLFSEDMDFSADMNYYPVPKSYQNIVNASFLVYKSQLYMVSGK
ncbi:hypothetical protein [Pedobacter duraquae]|uniref:Uncharacterized protein n=1 Tax=Pedobacter duraquae TaxID=425511 RepID=A0A4R6IM10_9SPHI|nr:hypothetical protein [Pedobacter duraquae]TDO23111.1 hypothetical protein CLV32_2098 [Pedobacter duraquae]